MKNEVQKLMEDVFRLYGDINQKMGSLDRIAQITRLYEELQSHLEGVSTEEVEVLETQIRSAMERLLTFSDSMEVVKTLKLTLDGSAENYNPTKAH
jgi:hypothetical protein